jgi:hypothetical protein
MNAYRTSPMIANYRRCDSGREEVYEFAPNASCLTFRAARLPRFRGPLANADWLMRSFSGSLTHSLTHTFTPLLWIGCCLAFRRPGKRVAVALVVVVPFDGDKIVHEHLCWDRASVLVQQRLLQPRRLPVLGADGARSLLDRSIRFNGVLQRSKGR